MNEIEITSEFIKLDSFMKFAGIVSLGSEAKLYIQDGLVKVNEQVETRRGKKLFKGDIVTFESNSYKIV